MPSEARAVAFSVVRRVFADGAYADRALPAEADRAGLDARDRALATRLAYGTVQRKATLDHLLAGLAERPVARLDPPVLAAARLGLYQLLYLDGVPDRAAVAESVDLAKGAAGRGAAGLVNAVLRRAAREGRNALLGPLHDRDPAGAALLHSVPLWLAEQWWSELGAETARALLAAANEPAEHALRANTLVSDRDAVAAALGVPSRTDSVLPEALVLEGPFDLRSSALWDQGAVWPQSRAAMAVARVVAPQAGERVLDLCAAPGGKATHLAALSGDGAEIVAVEQHPGRAEALRATCARLRARSVRVEVADAAVARADGRFRARARRPAVQRPGDARGPPRPALADDAGGHRRARRAAGPDARRGGRRDRARRHPGLRDLHDLRAGERGGDREAHAFKSGFRGR